MSTITRENCVELLNKYLQSHSLKDGIEVIQLASRNVDNPQKEDSISMLARNPILLDIVLHNAVEKLCTEFKIHSIATNNNPYIYFY